MWWSMLILWRATTKKWIYGKSYIYTKLLILQINAMHRPLLDSMGNTPRQSQAHSRSLKFAYTYPVVRQRSRQQTAKVNRQGAQLTHSLEVSASSKAVLNDHTFKEEHSRGSQGSLTRLRATPAVPTEEWRHASLANVSWLLAWNASWGVGRRQVCCPTPHEEETAAAYISTVAWDSPLSPRYCRKERTSSTARQGVQPPLLAPALESQPFCLVASNSGFCSRCLDSLHNLCRQTIQFQFNLFI